MRLSVNSELDITTEELVGKMSIKDVAEILGAIAMKLDGDFIDRVYCAHQFEDGLSESGARFLAEAITQRFMKKK